MIVVVGSINADLFFTVDQLPQQGETVLCPDYQMFLGGKGANQAVAAANAGAATRMVGAVGDDVFAAHHKSIGMTSNGPPFRGTGRFNVVACVGYFLRFMPRMPAFFIMLTTFLS